MPRVEMRHPFVLKLYATYQDPNMCYFLLELVQGGELFSRLAQQPEGWVDDKEAAFYAACVTSAFEHMHDRSVAYRDLKPENLLIDGQGYLKLVDFGFAKVVLTNKTFTLCGTPEYLAPEIILNKGHSTGADWWSLGILTYEMLVGAPPFTDESDPMVIYQQILAAVIPEPKRGKPPLSKPARAFIERLCSKEPSQRLGCMKHGVDEVKRHAFFSKINWQRLEKKLTQAPYIPTIENPLDVSNFDSDWDVPPNDHAALNSAATAHLFEGFG